MDTLITLLLLGFAFIIGAGVGAAAVVVSMEEKRHEEHYNVSDSSDIQNQDKS